MRRWVLAAVMTAAAHGAWAADLPELYDVPLRGSYVGPLSTTMVVWQGAYVGGHASYSASEMDFSQATSSLSSFILQNLAYQPAVSSWSLLGKSNPESPGFGGFVGYNGQWDEAVVGVEANYTHLGNLSGTQGNTLPFINIPSGCSAPPAGDTDVCGIKLSGSATAKVTDVLTLRGRGAYAIGNFLPYVFGGLALGRAEITRDATITQRDSFYKTSDNSLDYTVTSVTTKADSANVMLYGYTMGFGLETMLCGGLFARGEYEYIKFTTAKDITIQMNTVRAGLGYKF